MAGETQLNPERWVAEHGDILFRYALARVRNATVAEDLVQETFVGALKAREGFRGQSSERSWLVGILKHKLIDHIRRSSREQLQDPAEPDTAFEDDGHWRMAAGVAPKDWGDDAAAAFERREFWETLQRCLDKLPDRHARAFVLREMDDLPGEEVCKVLDVTPTNLWVLLHRARTQLRRCLEMNWFAK